MCTSVPRLSPLVSISEGLSTMDKEVVTSLPVEDAAGWLLGVARAADLSWALNAGSLTLLATVGDGPVPHLVTATPNMNGAWVAELMHERGLDDIMVVEGRSLVGAPSVTQAGQAATDLRQKCDRDRLPSGNIRALVHLPPARFHAREEELVLSSAPVNPGPGDFVAGFPAQAGWSSKNFSWVASV